MCTFQPRNLKGWGSEGVKAFQTSALKSAKPASPVLTVHENRISGHSGVFQ